MRRSLIVGLLLGLNFVLAGLLIAGLITLEGRTPARDSGDLTEGAAAPSTSTMPEGAQVQPRAAVPATPFARMYSENPKAKRIEFRPPDPSCNGYLAFSAMLMAGLDGIKNKLDPGKPTDADLFELSAEELKHIPTVPGSLDEALDALEKDHQFLLEGNVFTKDVIDVWLEYKRKREVDSVRMRPHPYEFYLYFDV